jgi:hypothetical protein
LHILRTGVPTYQGRERFQRDSAGFDVVSTGFPAGLSKAIEQLLFDPPQRRVDRRIAQRGQHSVQDPGAPEPG